MSLNKKEIFEFGPFRVVVHERLLSRDGIVINVTPKVFDLLCFLVRNGGRLISREELMRSVWPDSFVEESNLTVSISMLRKALGDQAGLVLTVPKQGYRFTGEVVRVEERGEAAEQELAAPKRYPGWTIVGLAIVVLILGIWWAGRPQAGPEPMLPVSPLTTDPAMELAPAISPDGTKVAFASEPPNGIFVMDLPRGEPVRVDPPGTSSFAPAWSPDGEQLAYVNRERGSRPALVVAGARGRGPIRKLVSFRNRGLLGREIRWTPNGKWILFTDQNTTDLTFLAAVAVDSGEVKRVSDPPSTIAGDQYGAFSPDGTVLVFCRSRTQVVGDYYAMRVTADLVPQSEPVRITSQQGSCGGVAWVPGTRDIVYAIGAYTTSALYRTTISADLTAREAWPVNFANEGGSAPAISAATAAAPSRLVFQRQILDFNLRRLEVNSPPPQGAEGSLWASSTRTEQTPAFSPDGKKVAFASTRSGSWELWVCHEAGDHCAQITRFGKSFSRSPSWSPDGKRLVFDSRVGGQSDLFQISAEGGAPRRLTDTGSNEMRPWWSRDGKHIYFQSNERGEYDVWRIPAEGGPREQLTYAGGYSPRDSPDGRWLYFQRLKGPEGIWRLRLPDGAPEEVIGGNWLAFAVARDTVYVAKGGQVAAWDLGAKTLRVLLQPKASNVDLNGFDLSPDGKSLLYVTKDGMTSDLFLVDNFR